MMVLPMPVEVADAIMRLSGGANKSDWDLLQHYIALKIVKARDQLEITPAAKLGGYCEGLRVVFELVPRAEAKLSGHQFKRDRSIVNEHGFVSEPFTVEDYD